MVARSARYRQAATHCPTICWPGNSKNGLKPAAGVAREPAEDRPAGPTATASHLVFLHRRTPLLRALRPQPRRFDDRSRLTSIRHGTREGLVGLGTRSSLTNVGRRDA